MRSGVEPDASAGPTLLRVVAEALILQDATEAVFADIRARRPFGQLAKRSGPMIARFYALRDLVPIEEGEVRAILHHHAVATVTALEFMALEWRSERLAAHVDALAGLGKPALRLEEIYAELSLRNSLEVRDCYRAC